MSEQLSYAPEEVNREWSEIYSELKESGDYRVKDWAHFTPEFVDKHMGQVNQEEIMRSVKKTQELGREGLIIQPEATVKIETSLPVTVVGVGDIHLGSIFTNHELWEEHRQLIMNTPGMYAILLHNLVDNAVPTKFAHNMLNNVIPPDVQFRIMQQHIKELDEKGKILGAISGDCHEGWSWAAAGIDPAHLLFGYEGRTFPILENGGILHVKMGRQRYDLGMWHKQGPFNSNFNPEHALRQNRRLGGRNTDAEFGAHHHNSVASMDYEGYKEAGKGVAYIRVGTYKGWWPKGSGAKLHDRFVIDRWGKSGEPPGNSITIYPFQHDIEANLGFESTLRHHEALRIAMWLELVDQKGEILSFINGDK